MALKPTNRVVEALPSRRVHGGVLTKRQGFYHPLVYVPRMSPARIEVAATVSQRAKSGFRAARLRHSRAADAREGLTQRATDRLLAARAKGAFASDGGLLPPGCAEWRGIRDDDSRRRSMNSGRAARASSGRRSIFLKTFGASTEPNQGWLIAPPGLRSCR